MPNDDKTRLPENSGGSESLSPGQDFGQYKVIRLLGCGGMGEVYEVENPVIGQRYALKLVNREIMAQPMALERFQQEARVMSGFDHPNIVKVDDYGETEGQCWLRMPLMGNFTGESGQVLRSLEDCLVPGQALPEVRVRDYLRQILSGLVYAHGQDAVHRDIKPSNILFDAEGRLKITDFGLVHMAGEDWLQSRVQLTVAQSMKQSADPDRTHLEERSGGSQASSAQALLGTFDYMAPEQKRGQPADARSDLYAVGLMAFRMLTGESVPGFKGSLRINPALSPGWDVWIERAMESRPETRYASAKAMLEALPDGRAPMADVGSRRTAVKKSRNGLWMGLAALLVVGVGLGLGYVMRDTGSGVRDTGGSASADLTAEDAEQIKEVSAAESTPGPELGSDYTVDLGGGVEMEFVWVAAINAWVGKYEVTNGEFRRFRSGHNSGEFTRNNRTLSLNGERQPVVEVSYEDAVAFAQWLSGRSGVNEHGARARLLTGDEWTAIARCGTSREFPWGDSWPPTRGNYSDMTAREQLGFTAIDGYRDGFSVTASVEKSGRNEWGLYGLSGNVWEWTSEQSGSSRLLRGASWLSYGPRIFLRVEDRITTPPSNRSSYNGVRVLLSAGGD